MAQIVIAAPVDQASRLFAQLTELIDQDEIKIESARTAKYIREHAGIGLSLFLGRVCPQPSLPKQHFEEGVGDTIDLPDVLEIYLVVWDESAIDVFATLARSLKGLGPFYRKDPAGDTKRRNDLLNVVKRNTLKRPRVVRRAASRKA